MYAQQFFFFFFGGGGGGGRLKGYNWTIECCENNNRESCNIVSRRV